MTKTKPIEVVYTINVDSTGNATVAAQPRKARIGDSVMFKSNDKSTVVKCGKPSEFAGVKAGELLGLDRSYTVIEKFDLPCGRIDPINKRFAKWGGAGVGSEGGPGGDR